MSTLLAPYVDGIPVVQDNNDRTQRFAVPATNQRVFNLTSRAIERYDGAVWVVDFGGGAGLTLKGTGSPEGALTAPVGTLFIQTDGANGEVLWRKATGAGNTGWASYSTFLAGIALTGALIIGADVNLYRAAADELKTDDKLTVVGDVSAAGGYRQTIDGWYQDNVVANQANVELTRAAGRFRAARAGSLTGVVVTATEARTVGTLTVKVFKNAGLAGAAGAQLGTMTAVLDGANTSRKATTQAKDTDAFAAGDELYATVTTDAGWLPITSDVRVALEIED